MSCYECKYGPKPCHRYNVEGHYMLCQVNKESSYDTYCEQQLADTNEIMIRTLEELKEMYRNEDRGDR